MTEWEIFVPILICTWLVHRISNQVSCIRARRSDYARQIEKIRRMAS